MSTPLWVYALSEEKMREGIDRIKFLFEIWCSEHDIIEGKIYYRKRNGAESSMTITFPIECVVDHPDVDCKNRRTK